MGYRWFDSFGITPAYPFGFGRSYTDFALSTRRVEILGGTIRVTVSVRNTGTLYAGRETVQVYVSQPRGKLEKAYQVLAGFAKTGDLAPGGEETVEIRFPIRSLASFVAQEMCGVIMQFFA